MTRVTPSKSRSKRKQQLKRRRILWTILFMVLGAYAAYQTVNYAKGYFAEVPSETVIKLEAETQAQAGTETVVATEAEAPAETVKETPSTVNQAAVNSPFTISANERWQYILVNKENPLDQTFGPEDTFLVQGKYKADTRIKTPVTDMFQAAAAAGIDLQVCSAYRTYDYQQKLFNKLKAKYSHLGDEAATAEAAKSIAKPGTSEHQTGLALDIVTPEYTQLDSGFANTKAGEWLAANAHEYGFILRYPKDKTEITQIIFEPWHFRYVGKEAAKIIYEQGLCYEEFYQQIQFNE